jgi:hypothetical protein
MHFRKPGSGQQDLISQIEHEEELATEKPCSLDKLNTAVDFEIFRVELIDILGCLDRKDKGGNAPFFMFRIIVLQKYFALSEEQPWFQIRDRFNFMRFLSLRPADEVPDKNTIRDFKNQLGAEGIVRLFKHFDNHLATLGLHGKEGAGRTHLRPSGTPDESGPHTHDRHNESSRADRTGQPRVQLREDDRNQGGNSVKEGHPSRDGSHERQQKRK